MQKMSSHRLNEQVYTLLMVVDQNHHGDHEAAGHCDIQPTVFSVTLPPPTTASLLRAQMVKRRQKSEFFLSDSGLAARGEGDCGKAGRWGSDVVWPLASFRCSAPRTDGITKDYRAMLGSSVCVSSMLSVFMCLRPCSCMCSHLYGWMYMWMDLCVYVCVYVCEFSSLYVCVSPLDSWRAKACWAVCHTSLTQESSNGV